MVLLQEAFFDTAGLWSAMDERRHARGLSWRQALDEVNAMSAELDRRLGGGHPIASSTVARLRKGAPITCQHALCYLRWLDETPESFMVPAWAFEGEHLPKAGSDRRLRWDVPAFDAALRAAKQERAMTWSQVAGEIGCRPSNLSGIANSRYGVEMTLAMRITGWLGRQAASFVVAAEW